VDGGLATALEEQGHVLHPWLWSAGVFLEDPQAVEDVHLAYLDAGAELLITASYQMSFAGLARAGLDRSAAEQALRRTVATARRASERHSGRALVAASIGPYGAALADGSEYRGGYGLSVDELVEFHRGRFDVLRDAGADLLAIETLPSLDECRAMCRLLEPHPDARAWVSFCCRDEVRLADGHPLAEAARLLDGCPAVVAVGVNCTDPAQVSGLMDAIRQGSGKPIVVYPNSGERWDGAGRRWIGAFDEDRFCRLALEWSARGAWAIGGCCRIGPSTIRRLSAGLRTAG
jgi:homocysteine S-methyltransferase